jgi:alpha-L-fucosidase 2
MMRPVYVLLCLLGFSALTRHADPGPLVLWSRTPATSWQQEANPIGNGKLAAMVFGGVASEQIQFNEDTIWTGQPHDDGNPNATPAHLASIRNKVFNRQDIWSEAQPYLMSVPLRQAHYQPAGTLNLTFPHSGLANYRRSLDLDIATVGVRYDFGGVTYSREGREGFEVTPASPARADHTPNPWRLGARNLFRFPVPTAPHHEAE